MLQHSFVMSRSKILNVLRWLGTRGLDGVALVPGDDNKVCSECIKVRYSYG